MDIHLKAMLEDAIDAWVDQGVDTDDWPDAYLGADTIMLMADAAAAVFDAVVEVQGHAIAEGYLVEA